MDQEQFQLTARELLERHIVETSKPKQAIPEIGSEPEPNRPETHPGARYASALGDYVSQTRAAEKNNELVNREYFDHQAERGSEQRQDARAALEKHIENAPPEPEHRISAREALLQHFRDAASEVTGQKPPPAPPDPQRQRSQDIEL
jgi:hypothetical protein